MIAVTERARLGHPHLLLRTDNLPSSWWITSRCATSFAIIFDRLAFRNILRRFSTPARSCKLVVDRHRFVDESLLKLSDPNSFWKCRQFPVGARASIISVEARAAAWFMKRDQRSWDCRLSHSVYPGREQQSEQPYAIFFKLSIFTFSFRITSHIVVGSKLFERLPVLVFSPRVSQMM